MRPLSGRCGVTLVELLVVVALWGLLLPAIGALHAAGARLVLAGEQSLRTERDLTTLIALLAGAVTGSTPAEIDARSDTLDFDRPLATVRSCGGSGGSGVVLSVMIPAAGFARAPTPGRDQVLVLVAGPPPRWERRTVTAVAVGACPLGESALSLTLDLPVAAAWRVRFVTPVRLRGYESAGRSWLGLEDQLGTATIQPIAGPYQGTIDFAQGAGRVTTTVESGQYQRFATLLRNWP